jgi:PhoPQ-activated pathogenicity-related protein
MTAIIDPLVYADRLTMPKLIIDAGGDEFFMVHLQSPKCMHFLGQ